MTLTTKALTSPLKALTTKELLEVRAGRKGQMETLQGEGRWVIADNYHEEYIAPVNKELWRRGVW